MASLDISGASRRYGSHAAVAGVDLAVSDGAFVALLGPSGCGKTTLLRLIAGFEVLQAGEIRLGGETVSRPGWVLPPEERGIGMVFQSYALWPHMTVAGNVEFALKVRGLDRRARTEKVQRALDLVGLAGYADRKPDALSGGQRQRVALARCLAMEPRLILLDEPLANLDAHLREAMQSEFRRVHREAGTTFIYVTHDQAEAMALADQIAVMDGGRIRQVADPRTLFNEPATPMVARFIGGGMVFPGKVRATDNGVVAELLGVPIRARGQAEAGDEVEFSIRPTDLEITDDASGGIRAIVRDVRYLGARAAITATAPDGSELRIEHAGILPHAGETIRVAVRDAWILPRSNVTKGSND